MRYTLLEVSGESGANCFTLLPVVQKLANERGIPVRHLELSEATAEEARSLGIQRVPTLIVYRDGEEVARCTGYQPEEILSLWLDAKCE